MKWRNFTKCPIGLYLILLPISSRKQELNTNPFSLFYRVKTSLIHPKHVIVQLNCQSFCFQTQFHHRIKKQTEHKRHYKLLLVRFHFHFIFLKNSISKNISWLFLFWLVLVCLNFSVAYTFFGKKNMWYEPNLANIFHLTRLRRLTHQIYLKILDMIFFFYIQLLT